MRTSIDLGRPVSGDVIDQLTILIPARDEVGEQVRAEIGERFAGERNAQVDADCGRMDNVRAIVAEAKGKGLLDSDD